METYLNQAVGYGRVDTLCVEPVNEGNRAGHTAGAYGQGENYEAELGIGTYEPAMNCRSGKNYQDQMEISLVHPDGTDYRSSWNRRWGHRDTGMPERSF